MRLTEKSQESMLAWFAYRCISNHDDYDSTKNYFNKPIIRKDLIDMIIKDNNIVCDTFIDCHNKINKEEKLLFLKMILKDKESLAKVLKRMYRGLITYECSIIIPYVIKNYPDLMEYVVKIYKINDPKYVKGLRMGIDIEEQLTGYLVMYKLI